MPPGTCIERSSVALRNRLTGCIGCGCLSLQACRLLSPGDEAATRGPGPRDVLDDA